MAAIQTYQRITVPTHWVAFAISLALHALLLWGGLPKLLPRMLPFDDTKEGRPSGSIAIRIAPAPKPPTPPPAPESRPQPVPSPKAPAPKPAPKVAEKPAPRTASKPSAPEVLAMERQTSQPPATARATAPGNDLAAYVEARRRARESADVTNPPAPPPQQPTESDQAREERIRATNLGLDREGAGSSRERGGGIFQIARVTSEDAEFFFYGWNKAIQRNSRQMIAVSRGSHATIEQAVVRKMIELIRERSSADFVFESKRLGRDVSLSARPADTAKLEEFLMREFFFVKGSGR
jgi:hypothetical protein